MSSRYLVTGGCGSIGSALVKRLALKGNTVCSFDHNEDGLFNQILSMPANIKNNVKTFVGDKTKKDLKQISPLVDKINQYQKDFESLNHDKLRKKTEEFKSRLFDKNKILFVQGIRGQGVVEVYSIIGNKIVEMNIGDLSNARIPIYLKSGHMYIVRIRDQKNNLRTFKILAS